MKRSAKDAAETRRRIVDVAEELFAKDGFTATSIVQIADRANVTEGAIFHYFKDKKQLYREIVDTLQHNYDNAVRAEAIKGTTAFDAIIRGSRAAIMLATEPPFARLVMLEGPAVLGEVEWREIYSKMGLSAEFGIRAITEGQNLPNATIKSMSILLLGMLNETIFAIVRKQPNVMVDVNVGIIEKTLRMWAEGPAENSAT